MEKTDKINGIQFAKMVCGGCDNLKTNASAINDLNVFPIPDGDTGDNMLLTMIGGARACEEPTASISDVARRIADGMLLAARGNSGVILSQFFDGIAESLDGVSEADNKDLSNALCEGAKHAYSAVSEPSEGTILTVARCSAEYAAKQSSEKPTQVLKDFINEGKRTLDKTPDMLPVLKKAGVVDSGGAGLVYIAEGMLKGLNAESDISAILPDSDTLSKEIDPDMFTEDSVLEFGYCTELLVRLQRCKTDPSSFDISLIIEYLNGIGDSVVAVKTGSLVKIHVHTFTPHKVLSYCQRFGEFLKVKIENMSLQHNSVSFEEERQVASQRKSFGIVSVCNGEGIKQMFLERGADIVIDGGQSMNPSAKDFISAFKNINADVIFVYPNNSNVILTAKQAALMYEDSAIKVIETKNIGEGYASISMFFADCPSAEELENELRSAIEGVTCVEISQSVRSIDGVTAGDYIGFIGKNILCSTKERIACAYSAADLAQIENYDICIIVYGKAVTDAEAAFLSNYINKKYPQKEVFSIDGGQDIYDYMLILE